MLHRILLHITPLRYHLIHAGVHITPFIKPESASDHQPTKNTGFTEKLHSVYHFQTSLDSEAGMRINHSEQGNVGRRNRKPAHRYGIGSATTQSSMWPLSVETPAKLSATLSWIALDRAALNPKQPRDDSATKLMFPLFLALSL